jgi:signal transduction histidine kinase
MSYVVRVLGLALVSWSVITAPQYSPGTSGRGLVVTVLFALCIATVGVWLRPIDRDASVTPELYVMAVAGGALVGASPNTAAAAFVFVAVVSAAIREGLVRSMQVAALGSLSLAVAVLVWDGGAGGLLAYSLGFAAAGLAAANVRQFRLRAEQAELLLAQSQRSQEETLRAARLEESTRIAREIHDVLAHALAGLTIQLEATTSLIENDADRGTILARVRRAHELAREGLRETRRAVGALRGDEVAIPDGLRALAAEAEATLTVQGDPAALHGDGGRAVLRIVQESLTNVAKHAPDSEVTITVQIGAEVVAVVESRFDRLPVATPAGGGPAGSLSVSGGGYGITGMRERAAALGGTLSAGPTDTGWRVELRIPGPGDGGQAR